MENNPIPAAVLDQADKDMRRLTDLLLDLYEKHVGEFSHLALWTASINAIFTLAMRRRPDEAPAEVASFLECAARQIRAGKATPYTTDAPQQPGTEANANGRTQ